MTAMSISRGAHVGQHRHSPHHGQVGRLHRSHCQHRAEAWHEALSGAKPAARQGSTAYLHDCRPRWFTAAWPVTHIRSIETAASGAASYHLTRAATL